MNIEEAIKILNELATFDYVKLENGDIAIETLLTAYEKEKKKNNRYKELLIKVLSLNSEISEEKEILLDAFSRRKRGVKMNIEEFNKEDILGDFEYELNKLCRSCIGTATEIQIKQRPLISLFHKLVWFYETEKEKNKELYNPSDMILRYYNSKKKMQVEIKGFISKNKLKEIIYPSPENPIPIEIQQSEMYKKLLKEVEE